MSRPRLAPAVGILLLAGLAVGLILLRMLMDRPPGGSLRLAWPEPSYAVFRRTAVIVCLLVGSSLGVSGVLLQALLRNPLASPFILGLSSGAGLGVMLSWFLADRTGLGLFVAGGETLPAIIGSIVTLAIVYALGQRRGWLDPVSLVLIGVVVAAICGAVIMMLHHLSPGGVREDITRWMFGRIPQGVATGTLLLTGGLSMAAIIIAFGCGRAMDAATLGDDEARSIGVPLRRLRTMLFIVAGLLTATAVAIAGPIGFVGLIAPHATRLLIGPRHAPLVIGAALAGAVLMLLAEVASQALHTGAGRMPVGIFTALLGGPTFIWLLRSGRGQV